MSEYEGPTTKADEPVDQKLLEFLHKRATSPPWYFDGDRNVTSPNRGKQHQDILEMGVYGCRLAAVDRSNARLIVALRNAVPKIMAELGRTREHLRTIEQLNELAADKNNAMAELMSQNDELVARNAEKDRKIETLETRLRWIADHDGGPERDGLFHDWEWGNDVPDGIDPGIPMYEWLNEALDNDR